MSKNPLIMQALPGNCWKITRSKRCPLRTLLSGLLAACLLVLTSNASAGDAPRITIDGTVNVVVQGDELTPPNRAQAFLAYKELPLLIQAAGEGPERITVGPNQRYVVREYIRDVGTRWVLYQGTQVQSLHEDCDDGERIDYSLTGIFCLADPSAYPDL